MSRTEGLARGPEPELRASTVVEYKVLARLYLMPHLGP